jgi:hypothetical protein
VEADMKDVVGLRKPNVLFEPIVTNHFKRYNTIEEWEICVSKIWIAFKFVIDDQLDEITGLSREKFVSR